MVAGYGAEKMISGETDGPCEEDGASACDQSNKHSEPDGANNLLIADQSQALTRV
jgi:hypothetical protein